MVLINRFYSVAIKWYYISELSYFKLVIRYKEGIGAKKENST